MTQATADTSGRQPRSIGRGELRLGSHVVECHVLDDERRVIGMRSTVKALTGVDGGNLVHRLRIKGLNQAEGLAFELVQTIAFSIPGAPDGEGITVEKFHEVCRAFIEAAAAGRLRTVRQMQIAAQCAVLMSACAVVGLTALVDEATGYQTRRAPTDLQARVAAFIAEDMRKWECRFLPEFWTSLAKLTRSRWSGGTNKPRWWAQFINRYCYEGLDSDVAAELRRRNPNPTRGNNLHQLLTDFGTMKLNRHLDRVLGIMQSSHDFEDFKMRFAAAFRGGPLQLPFGAN